jgi:hypothetical protein
MTNVKVIKLVPVTLNGKLKTVTVKVTKPVSPQPHFSKGGRGGIIALCFLLFALCFLLFAFPLEAKVSGFCSNCHTMHNSQGGRPMAKEYSSSFTNLKEDSTPNADLLIADCIGCHFNNGAATIDNYHTPIVLNRNTPSNPLAGGNFHYVADGLGAEYNKGHNVMGISAQESSNMNTPPGFKANIILPNGGTGPESWSQQLSCSGKFGCHGDRTITDEFKAIHGGHHGNINIDNTSPANTIYNSYRFLLGIKGAESSDWEQNVKITDHNGYQGDSAYGNVNTISYFCGECHGNFHANSNLGGTSEVGDSTPWLRHPADFAFIGVRDGNYTGSEYAQYNTPNTKVYSTVAPVAEVSPSTNSTVTSASIVMCLSCHRAHASPYFKMMRWTYKCWPECKTECTEGYPCTNGCNVCHTTKN